MPTCTRDTLISGAACLNGKVLSAQEKLARRVWFDLQQLAAVGGTDYSADLATLNTDADTLTCGMSLDDLSSAEMTIAYNNAVAAGASIETDKDALADDVKCLQQYPPHVLKRMILMLYYKLGYGTGL